MAWEWEMTLGMDFGMGMGDSYSTSSAAIAEVEVTASPASLYALPSADTLRIDGVLDFSGHDLFPSAFDATAAAADTRFFTAANPSSADTSFDLQSHQTPFDFYAPCEEAAELEWLSQFVEDSFSDVPCQYTGLDAPSGENQLRVDQCITNRAARSRRSKPTNPSAVWSSLTQPPQPSPSSSSSSSSSDLQPSKPISIVTNGKGSSNSGGKKGGGDGGVRRCTHCASEKTPQWRTGPLGPKTLCNACGVRHKSGRLVPEYRPAASPTFVLAQHSNSHRKVMELRRQKELLLLRHKNQPSSSAAAAKPELLLDDYNVG